MAIDIVSNSYEDARRRRLEDNKKRFEDLGIAKISKSLTKPDKTLLPVRSPRKQKLYDVYATDPRRSSRARNPVPSYRDDLTLDIDPGLRSYRKRKNPGGSIGRPLEGVRYASSGERAKAFKIAEKLQENLESSNPIFVKSMLQSHVYRGFWLGLPSHFCEKYLFRTDLEMVLEDEDGEKYPATYLGNKFGLSAGWRGFALSHELDDGDALVFELVEPTRFKIYIVRVVCQQDEKTEKDKMNQVEEPEEAEEVKKGIKKLKKPKREIAKKTNEKEFKKPKSKQIKSGDETNGVGSNSQGLRRSNRSSTK